MPPLKPKNQGKGLALTIRPGEFIEIALGEHRLEMLFDKRKGAGNYYRLVFDGPRIFKINRLGFKLDLEEEIDENEQ